MGGAAGAQQLREFATQGVMHNADAFLIPGPLVTKVRCNTP
jgi:hypothetical protein